MKLTKETEYKDTLYIDDLFKFGIMEIHIEYAGYDIIAEGTEYEKRRNHYNLSYLTCSSEMFSCFADISFEDMINKIIEHITVKRKQKEVNKRRSQQAYFYNKEKEDKRNK